MKATIKSKVSGEQQQQEEKDKFKSTTLPIAIMVCQLLFNN